MCTIKLDITNGWAGGIRFWEGVDDWRSPAGDSFVIVDVNGSVLLLIIF